ncbi:hypothetical protein WEB32_03535 [Streptomyces netropsis]|uniref:Uncharacterized protein n=1 Tax=Streptomyces netropsis TaxID=55404 RepID=A0A7W7LBP4_STRNE|nr:hypothetical protein [Streptomyces netropsis]MBB4887247.1 hypothetical protein [Streptomyces netropsis]GGR08920.1 hypothetical protein GCM10010219_11750 [Streptomyces netropsis]
MRTRLEGLGSRMLDLLVPRMEASAAEAACWCYECVQGGSSSGCAGTDHLWYRKQPCGGGTWVFARCANCRKGSGYCI